MCPIETEQGTAIDRLNRLAGYAEQDPSNRTLVVEAAQLALQSGNASRALPWLEHLLEGFPDDGALIALKGNLLLGMGQPAEAEAIFESLIARGEAHPTLRFNLAWARTQRGNLAGAFEALDSIPVDARDQLPRYWFLRGQAAYHKQAFDDALASINRFLVTTPDDREAIGIRGLILLDSGAADEAAQSAKALLKLSPESAVARLVLGTLALEQRQVDAAEQHLQPVTQTPSLAGRAWSALGFVSLLGQKLDAAEQRFVESVKTMPNHLGTWHGLAWVRIMKGDLTGARDAVEHAMRVNRSFADNHGTLGVIEAMQGRLTEAELSVKRALRLNPASAAALYAKSLILAKSGNKAGSEKVIEGILDGRSFADAQSIARIMAEQAGLKRH